MREALKYFIEGAYTLYLEKQKNNNELINIEKNGIPEKYNARFIKLPEVCFVRIKITASENICPTHEIAAAIEGLWSASTIFANTFTIIFIQKKKTKIMNTICKVSR